MSEKSDRQKKALDEALAASRATQGESPRKAQLEPGWYVDKGNGATRWWDGSQWTSDMGKPESPWQSIVGGFVVTVIGLVLAYSSTEDEAFLALIGYIISAVGSAAMLIGVIAAGVRQGARWVAWEKQQREGR